MRGLAIGRNSAANNPAPHPNPLPARGERGSLRQLRRRSSKPAYFVASR